MYDMLRNVNRGVVRAEKLLMMILLSAIVIVMTMQVFMRYVLQTPITWSQELMILMLIYMSYISADVVLYSGGHIGISYFVELLPERMQHAVDILVNLLIIIAMARIFPESIRLIQKQAGHIIAGVLPLSKSYWIAPIAIVFPLMILKCFEKILASMKKMHTQEAGL